jgi:hypothetical protein
MSGRRATERLQYGTGMRVLFVGGHATSAIRVHEPDPLEATVAHVDWLWEHREAFLAERA